jgi:hypothetical protein
VIIPPTMGAAIRRSISNVGLDLDYTIVIPRKPQVLEKPISMPAHPKDALFAGEKAFPARAVCEHFAWWKRC